MGTIRHSLVVVMALLASFVVPGVAHAADPLECTATGEVEPGTSFFDTDKTAGPLAEVTDEDEENAREAAGDPFFGDPGKPAEDADGVVGVDKGVCDYTGIKHIFSQVLCDFLKVLTEILSKVYCGIQYQMIGALRILLSIYVAVFGFQMLMGTAQLNTRDVILRLIKIGLVWSFATKATWGVNIIFMGAVGFINDASYWIINSIEGIQDIDITSGHCGAIEFSESNTMPLFGFFDCLIYYTFMGTAHLATLKVIGLFGSLMVVYPPLALIAFGWASKTFLTMARSVISLLLALASLAFLVALTPIFLSFMLFKVTMQFFENWLRYMVSYCIQVVMTFAVIVMWILVFTQFLDFFKDLSNLVFEYNHVVEQPGVLTPSKVWAICPAEYTFTDGVPYATCKKVDGRDFDPYPGKDDANPFWEKSDAKLIPPSMMIKDTKFLYYIFYHLIGLSIITYAFSVVIDQIPKISQSIASPAALPHLFGGFGSQINGSSTGLGADNIRGSVGSLSRNAAANASKLTGKR